VTERCGYGSSGSIWCRCRCRTVDAPESAHVGGACQASNLDRSLLAFLATLCGVFLCICLVGRILIGVEDKILTSCFLFAVFR